MESAGGLQASCLSWFISVIMSFCFNFDISGQTNSPQDVDGKKLQSGQKANDANFVSNIS